MKLCICAPGSQAEPVFVEATLVSGTDTPPPSLLIDGTAVSLADAERAGYVIAQASREERMALYGHPFPTMFAHFFSLYKEVEGIDDEQLAMRLGCPSVECLIRLGGYIDLPDRLAQEVHRIVQEIQLIPQALVQAILVRRLVDRARAMPRGQMGGGAYHALFADGSAGWFE